MDLARSVVIAPVMNDLTNQLIRRNPRPVASFDPTYFTPRELKIMKMLAEIFRETRGEDMSEVSHARRLPWDKVHAGGKGMLGSDS